MDLLNIEKDVSNSPWGFASDFNARLANEDHKGSAMSGEAPCKFF